MLATVGLPYTLPIRPQDARNVFDRWNEADRKLALRSTIPPGRQPPDPQRDALTYTRDNRLEFPDDWQRIDAQDVSVVPCV